jgi:two-component system nitrate/nitrite response regulator NarL
VGEAGDAGEAQRRAAELLPDVILLDNHLPGVNGIDALPGLLEAAPRAQVLMLTVSEDERDLAAALRGGARGYLLKTVDSDMLAAAIERTARGESTVSPEMTGKLVNAFQSLPGATTPPACNPAEVDAEPAPSLSPREQEILAQIALGASNKEIAKRLNVTERTVKAHLTAIFRKLGLTGRLQLALFALEHGRSAREPEAIGRKFN